MRISRGGESEVAFVLFRVTRLLERAQHQERQDSLLRLARNLLRQLLVHARGDVHLFGNLNLPRILTAAVARSLVGLELHSLDGQRTHAQRVSKARRHGRKVKDLLRVRLFVDAVNRRHAQLLQV